MKANAPHGTVSKGQDLRAVVDTNVMIDALANRTPWAEEAQELLRLASLGNAKLSLSGSTVTDLFYLLNKWTFHDRRKTRAAIQVLLESFGVVPVGYTECSLAAHSDMPDFEDAVLAYAAKAAHVDYLVTRNLEDYEHSPVPAILPGDYLGLLS